MGEVVVKAVSQSWTHTGLDNPPIDIMGLPVDIIQAPIALSNSFLDDPSNNCWLKLYKPSFVAWDGILNSQGASNQKNIDGDIYNNLARIEKVRAQSRIMKQDGKMITSNLLSDGYFVTSNPEFVDKLYEKKVKKVPPYKTMLQNGIPVLEVIQTIKPYSLQGSNIVFVGSANSFNAQGGALIVVDGVNRGTDASVINGLNPYDVDRINVSTNPQDIQRYTGLNSVGIIEITLKMSRAEAFNGIPEAPEEPPTEFSAPNYDERKSRNIDEDYRSTLHWEIIPLVPSQNVSTTTYFNGDFISNVTGKLIWIPQQGIPTESQFDYVIK